MGEGTCRLRLCDTDRMLPSTSTVLIGLRGSAPDPPCRPPSLALRALPLLLPGPNHWASHSWWKRSWDRYFGEFQMDKTQLKTEQKIPGTTGSETSKQPVGCTELPHSKGRGSPCLASAVRERARTSGEDKGNWASLLESAGISLNPAVGEVGFLGPPCHRNIPQPKGGMGSSCAW